MVLRPTIQSHFFIKDGGWTDSTITFSLTSAAGSKWADVLTEGATEDMKVVSIDTGGGPVPMPGGERILKGVP